LEESWMDVSEFGQGEQEGLSHPPKDEAGEAEQKQEEREKSAIE